MSLFFFLRPRVFDDIRQDIINGLDSAQAEATGWDAVVKAGIPVSAVVRTSDTVVTITLPAFASYAITANEVITDTIPGSAVVTGSPIVATPTFSIINEGAGGDPEGSLLVGKLLHGGLLRGGVLVR